MFEVRDIKLFGKTIEAAQSASDATGEDSSNQDPPCSSNHSMLEDSNNLNNDADEQESPKSSSSPKENDAKEENLPESLTSEELKDSSTAPPIAEDSKTEEESQDKTLKKPDKIIPCPRCNSMETKFCYFNNYNVSQPRHFCKKCQRYWTAGGTMRNVPVGAGRRKNKNAARHLTCPESVRVDLVNGAHHPNGTVLTFTSDAPLCESMVSSLDIADKTVRNGSISCNENGDEHKNGSPEMIPKCQPFPQQVPVFPGAPWPYPWSFGPSGFPLPFYSTPPPPYWACALPGSWNIPWIIPQTCPSSGLNPPTLGKHSRDENVLKSDNNPEKRLWVPKTLRIDDPEEAAKSSIWATLGIKHDRVDSIGGGGLFKAFESQSKYEKKVPESSTVLQANPAALSRSLNFHESS